MQRHLQLTITEPILPLSSELTRMQIECTTISVDLFTGEVKLPGGFVCTLSGLMHVLSQAKEARSKFMWAKYTRKEKL